MRVLGLEHIFLYSLQAFVGLFLVIIACQIVVVLVNRL